MKKMLLVKERQSKMAKEPRTSAGTKSFLVMSGVSLKTSSILIRTEAHSELFFKPHIHFPNLSLKTYI